MTPVLGVRLGRSPVERRLWWANALLTFTATYSLINWAEMSLPSGLAAVLFATFPLFVAILAHFWIPGERLRKATLAGVLIGFLGVAVLFSEDLDAVGGPRTVFAAFLMLLAPLVSAIGNVAVKRWGKGIHKRLSATGLSLINYAIPVVAVLIGTLWLGEPFTARIFVGGLLVVAGVAIAVR